MRENSSKQIGSLNTGPFFDYDHSALLAHVWFHEGKPAMNTTSRGASHSRKMQEEVLRAAHTAQAAVLIAGSGKPHITITKRIADANDPYVHAMLSGIEHATHSHFGHSYDIGGVTLWTLKTRDIDVTVRVAKGFE